MKDILTYGNNEKTFVKVGHESFDDDIEIYETEDGFSYESKVEGMLKFKNILDLYEYANDEWLLKHEKKKKTLIELLFNIKDDYIKKIKG